MNIDEYWGAEPQSEYVHVSELEDVEQAKDFLSVVVEGLYGDKPLAHGTSFGRSLCLSEDSFS